MGSNALGVLYYFSNFQIDNVRTFLKWDTNIKIYGTDQLVSGQQSGGYTGNGCLLREAGALGGVYKVRQRPPQVFVGVAPGLNVAAL